MLVTFSVPFGGDTRGPPLPNHHRKFFFLMLFTSTVRVRGNKKGIGGKGSEEEQAMRIGNLWKGEGVVGAGDLLFCVVRRFFAVSLSQQHELQVLYLDHVAAVAAGVAAVVAATA